MKFGTAQDSEVISMWALGDSVTSKGMVPLTGLEPVPFIALQRRSNDIPLQDHSRYYF